VAPLLGKLQETAYYFAFAAVLIRRVFSRRKHDNQLLRAELGLGLVGSG
jgi:hypothetical protein